MLAYTIENKCCTCKNWFELHPDVSGICFGFAEPKDTDEDDTCERYNKGIPKSLLDNETDADLAKMLQQHKINFDLKETVDNFFLEKAERKITVETKYEELTILYCARARQNTDNSFSIW